MLEFEKLIEIYGGWAALFIYFAIQQLWPYIKGNSMSEREFRHQIESRRADANDRIATAMNLLTVNMTQTNERISSILANQALLLQRQEATFGVLTDAISDMKAITGANRRKGDTGKLPPLKGEMDD